MWLILKSQREKVIFFIDDAKSHPSGDEKCRNTIQIQENFINYYLCFRKYGFTVAGISFPCLIRY